MVLDKFVHCLDDFGEIFFLLDFVGAHELNHVQHTIHDFVLVGSNVAVA